MESPSPTIIPASGNTAGGPAGQQELVFPPRLKSDAIDTGNSIEGVRRCDIPSPDFAWLVEQGPEFFEKYQGKWVAVRAGKVIGIGDTATEAADQARDAAPDESFILGAVDTDADVIYACT